MSERLPQPGEQDCHCCYGCAHPGEIIRAIEPFSIRLDEQVLSDLKARIRNTRWPDQAPGAAWEQGTDLGYLRDMLAYWADGFDWRAQERELNRLDHFRIKLDGIYIHFVYERARRERGIPLILTHGWPIRCFLFGASALTLVQSEPLVKSQRGIKRDFGVISCVMLKGTVCKALHGRRDRIRLEPLPRRLHRRVCKFK